MFALMASTPEGSKVVAQCMHDTDIFGLVCEVLDGKKWITGGEVISSASEDNRAMENSGPEQEREIGSSMTMAMTAEAPQAGGAGAGADGRKRQRAADRSNVLMMVSELLKHHGEQMASFRREVFEDLVRSAGKGVVSEAEILR